MCSSDLIRGKLAPNGRLGAKLDDLRDSLADVWRRIRGEPLEVPSGFRKWWDVKLDPSESLRTLVEVTDARIDNFP